MRIGFDVDGVLANFNERFIQTVIDVTGKDLFPARPFEPTTWNYPEAYGYTAQDVSLVWGYIKQSGTFWASLQPYPETRLAMIHIQELIRCRHDVYFVTARPGVQAKAQTERWLAAQTDCLDLPVYTVLIASDKAKIAQALELDYYIDDRIENIVAVGETLGMTEAYILSRPWNTPCSRFIGRIWRVGSVLDFTTMLFSRTNSWL